MLVVGGLSSEVPHQTLGGACTLLCSALFLDSTYCHTKLDDGCHCCDTSENHQKADLMPVLLPCTLEGYPLNHSWNQETRGAMNPEGDSD